MSQLTPKEEHVHVGAFLPRRQRDMIFELAARRDRSVSSIVRLALQAELERDRHADTQTLGGPRMKLFGKTLDDFEAACLDGTKVAWFGSVEVGGGEESASQPLPWRSAELYPEQPGSMGSREIDGGFGIRETE